MKTLVTALSIAAFSTVAFAAAPSFAEADTDGNGMLTMEEAKAALPDVDEAKIAAADVNQDGGLSEGEYTALTAS